ncbi:LAETG motif-containing sortase-dependent surface protein [Streptomyces sp. NBC_00932]|uniref:LAETG motif-containing sortase-dependent surface protein n=1 Tax=Streptomyces sp. NBC_00932 TaxID=2903690 RepID=UPI00386A0DFD|nr:LPXTG cell wall anchor domain-containing protein [Streptomyces sp. NBC_00932]
MTVSNRSWRLRGAFIAAAASVVGVGLCAVPAQAHTPTWSVSCSEVTLDLTAYNPGVTNTVTVSVDGKDILPTEKFGSSVNKTLPLGEHTKPLTVHLVVKAGDGGQFSKDDTKTAPVCATPPPTAPPVTQTPTGAPSSAAPAPSKSPSSAPSSPAAAAPAPSPSASAPSDLAETGSSSATPLIAGAAAVVILAGGGIMFAARKRRSSEN